APPSVSRSLPSPCSPSSRTEPPAPSRARFGGRSASRSPHSSPLSPSPPPETDMQPLSTAGGFSQGPQRSENTAVGEIPDNHNEQPGNTQTRRRGAEPEKAILDPGWEQLIAEGYQHFPIDTAAARAPPRKPRLSP